MFYTLYFARGLTCVDFLNKITCLLDPGYLVLSGGTKKIEVTTDAFDFSVVCGINSLEMLSKEYEINFNSKCTFELNLENDACVEKVIEFVGNFANIFTVDFVLQSNGERFVAIRKDGNISVSASLEKSGFPFNLLKSNYSMSTIRELI